MTSNGCDLAPCFAAFWYLVDTWCVYFIERSPLKNKHTRNTAAQQKQVSLDGRTIWVKVSWDEGGRWRLEIHDGHSNVTAWPRCFSRTDTAFEAAASAIHEEGIAAFIGPRKSPINVDHYLEGAADAVFHH